MRNLRRFVSGLFMALALTAISLSVHARLPGDDPDSGLEALDFIVAVVNDDVILASELKDHLRTVIGDLRRRGAQIPAPQVLHKQVLDRVVLTRLQLQEAETSGIRLDDDTLNRAVRNIAQENGLNLAEFRTALQKEGFSFASFREQIRDQLIISRLRQRKVNNRVAVTSQEVDAFLASQESAGNNFREFHIGHILISLPSPASPDQIAEARQKADALVTSLRAGGDFSQAAIENSSSQQALEGGDLGWRPAAEIPVVLAERATALKDGEISDAFRSPAGYHIVKMFESRSTQSMMIEQIHGRHILIKTNTVITDQEARRRLGVLRERVENGEDFAILARSNSDDTGSAAKGGDLGWVSPGEMVENFEKILFALPNGEISEPFQSEFGWHIAQALERRQHNAALDMIRNKAAEHLRKRKTEEELEQWLRSLRDDAYIDYRLDR